MTTKSSIVKLDGNWVTRPAWYRPDRWLWHWLKGDHVMPKDTSTLVNHPCYRGTVEKSWEE